MCAIVGSETTEKLILPVYSRLLADSSTKVRLTVVGNFDKIKSVWVFLRFHAGAVSADPRDQPPPDAAFPQKRPRLAHSAVFADADSAAERAARQGHHGARAPPHHLRVGLCGAFDRSYTTDTVAAVRETAAEILKRLYGMYGEEFAENTLLPTLSDLVHNEKYMLRITGLNIMAVGIEGCGER